MDRCCWGILRERPHSPDRVRDDELILRRVAEVLDGRGLDVSVLEPETIPARSGAGAAPDLIFYMCEATAALRRLAVWDAEAVPLVNPLRGVVNTFRHNMTRLLAGRPYYPGSLLVSTDAAAPGLESGWVKRGDYHATTRDDVRYAPDRESLRAALTALRDRGVTSALVQEHREGDLLKFYGVRDARSGLSHWFRHFYHADQDLKHHPFDPTRLRKACEEGAALLGLEVYGGDVIVDARGAAHVIDFNAWPSFALYRDEAAGHISNLIQAKLAALPRRSPAPAGRVVAG